MVGHSRGWGVNHKNINFSEIFLSIRLCRALFAHHFAKNKLKIWSINNGTKIKILKNILAISTRGFWNFPYFDPSAVIYWSNLKDFFYQNDQQRELYKVRQIKKISDHSMEKHFWQPCTTSTYPNETSFIESLLLFN